ncbi:AraC family transcriptional regulator [Algiphilus sp.]|uniref:AraC family transcriptional regulator n=1 Tax=Algiphilus sp. TaxID=1872431 RepID=UPI0025C18E0C|nr:AraC family transcriptional regulator [Algiphilus sp.]MCK5770846.1 AraC family transcriptional regulator [Algiphilus sp.]
MPEADSVLHPIVISQVMINFAARHGVDADTCLLGTGITDADLLDGEALVTRQQEMRLVENLLLALPDVPALGFELGLHYSVSTFGIWGFAMRTSRTLRDAVVLATRYLPLSTAYCRIHGFDESGLFGVEMVADGIPRHLRQFLLERDMATGINLLNELGLSGLQLAAVEFRETPPYRERIAALCGLEPRFGSARNALLVRAEDANRPLPMFDPHLVRMLDDQCRQQLQRRQVGGVAGQVRQQLLGPLGLVASCEDVAGALAMSPRSLRRKLDQEGTSFRTLVEEERRQLALRLLEGSRMKLDELALQLGYTDTASFSRAVRRWTGCSPGQYRRDRNPAT